MTLRSTGGRTTGVRRGSDGTRWDRAACGPADRPAAGATEADSPIAPAAARASALDAHRLGLGDRRPVAAPLGGDLDGDLVTAVLLGQLVARLGRLRDGLAVTHPAEGERLRLRHPHPGLDREDLADRSLAGDLWLLLDLELGLRGNRRLTDDGGRPRRVRASGGNEDVHPGVAVAVHVAGAVDPARLRPGDDRGVGRERGLAHGRVDPRRADQAAEAGRGGRRGRLHVTVVAEDDDVLVAHVAAGGDRPLAVAGDLEVGELLAIRGVRTLLEPRDVTLAEDVEVGLVAVPVVEHHPAAGDTGGLGVERQPPGLEVRQLRGVGESGHPPVLAVRELEVGVGDLRAVGRDRGVGEVATLELVAEGVGEGRRIDGVEDLATLVHPVDQTAVVGDDDAVVGLGRRLPRVSGRTAAGDLRLLTAVTVGDPDVVVLDVDDRAAAGGR